MGPLSSAEADGTPASPEFIDALRADAGAGPVTFERFMRTALYDPKVGYYRKDRPRVGYGSPTSWPIVTPCAFEAGYQNMASRK